MKKKVQIHRISTEDKTDIVSVSLKDLKEIRCVSTLHKVSLVPEDFKYSEYQHLYFTSDEKIEEGDWYYNLSNHIITQVDKRYDEIKNPLPHRKIIATTDKSLFYKWDTIDGIKTKSLPQIPQSFINQYVEAGGKIDGVEIEMEEYVLSSYGLSDGEPSLGERIKITNNSVKILRKL